MDRLVHGTDAGLRRGVLGHVRRLARPHVVPHVIQRSGLPHHQAGQFQLDVRLGQRVGHGLVRADGGLPDLAGLRVVDGLGEGVPAHPDGEGGGHDPLGVESGEQLEQARVLVAHEGGGRQAYVVQGEFELFLRGGQFHVDDRTGEAGGVARDDEQAGLEGRCGPAG